MLLHYHIQIMITLGHFLCIYTNRSIFIIFFINIDSFVIKEGEKKILAKSPIIMCHFPMPVGGERNAFLSNQWHKIT